MKRSVLSIGIACTGILLMRLPAFALTQDVGDKVVVINHEVPVKVGDEVVDILVQGMVLVVREVRGDQIEISRGKPGTIAKRHVIPFSEAMDYWNRAIRSNPDDGEAYLARVFARRELKESDKADADHQKAVYLNRKSARTVANRARVWVHNGEFDIGIMDYNQAIRLAAFSCDARERATNYLHRGLAWCYKREYDKAIADFTEAIQLDPKYDKVFDAKYATVYYNRAIAEKNKREYDKAITDYGEAIRLDPKAVVPYIRYRRGGCFSARILGRG